jgi:hypothetical protein
MNYLNFNKACQRPDGSIYGIEDGKECRKGSPITLDAKTVNLAYKKAKEKGARSKDLKAITDKVKKSFPDGFSSSDSKIALINELNSFKPKTLSSRLKDVKERTLDKGKQLRETLATKIKSRVKLGKEREEAAKEAKGWGLTKDQELEIFRKAMEKFPIRDKTRASVRASKKAFVEATKNYKKYAEEAKRNSDQELKEVLGQIKEKGISPSAIANAREKVSKKFTNLNTKEAREALVAELRKELGSKPDPKVKESNYLKATKKAENLIKEQYGTLDTTEAKKALETELKNLKARFEELENSIRYRTTPGSSEPLSKFTLKALKKEAKNLLDKNPDLAYDLQFFATSNSKEIPLTLLYSLQGFHSRPELTGSNISLKERSDLLLNPSGDPYIFYRGSTPQFTNQLLGIGKNGEYHGAGRGLYGNGTYAATANRGSIEAETLAKNTANSYAEVSQGKSGTLSNSVISFGIRSDANVVRHKDLEEFKTWGESLIQEAKEKTGFTFLDVGHAAAAMGIHAYGIDTGSKDGIDYWVILNRGAIVASVDYN